MALGHSKGSCRQLPSAGTNNATECTHVHLLHQHAPAFRATTTTINQVCNNIDTSTSIDAATNQPPI